MLRTAAAESSKSNAMLSQILPGFADLGMTACRQHSLCPEGVLILHLLIMHVSNVARALGIVQQPISHANLAPMSLQAWKVLSSK